MNLWPIKLTGDKTILAQIRLCAHRDGKTTRSLVLMRIGACTLLIVLDLLASFGRRARRVGAHYLERCDVV